MKKAVHLLLSVCLLAVLSCEKGTEPSTNAGWHTIYQAADSVTYNEIFFLDKNNGWIIGNHATILHSVDGGINWKKEASPGRSSIGLNSVCFSNNQHGWIVGDDFEIYYTTDGGSTWNYNLPVLPAYT
ncbi:MAG: YCF48-related protein, partial [Calditrichaceae bacterium]